MPSPLLPHRLPNSLLSLRDGRPNLETLEFYRRCLPRTRRVPSAGARTVTMRDRSKNRKPLQKGRNLSIEAIHAVQALKRVRILGGRGGCSGGGPTSLDCVMESKVRRLIKSDMMAVLGELQQQNQAFLALQVFEEVRRENWYQPKLSVYVDMITVLARNGLLKQIELVCSFLKMESWGPDTEGFNSLLRTLLDFGFIHTTMDCFRLMKLWESDPDESTFRILINGLESKGEMDISATVREEAQKLLGKSLDFLEEGEEMVCA
uniref:Pentatricopeptide repeat-containing protein At3g46870 n=1 Tax=Anthurium amnicola TaxID=1678845 RepID=A0A1D1Z180_9ARAE